MLDLTHYAFETISPVSAAVTVTRAESVTYTVEGPARVHRVFPLDGQGPVTVGGYLVLDYAAFDLRRELRFRQPLISGVKDGQETPLILVNDTFTDGRQHRVIVPVDAADYDCLRLRLYAYAPYVRLDVFRLAVCNADELPAALASAPCSGEGYETIDLSGLADGTLSDAPGLIDGGAPLPAGCVGIDGIPFSLCGRVMRPAPAPAENDDIIHNFTVDVKRGLCRPVSRESVFSVPVGMPAEELFFILALDGCLHERWGFCAPDPAILGSNEGEVMMPLCASDIERYAVRIFYADGRVDECFPTRLSDGRHEISGCVGVYGVRADGGLVERVEFEDRMPATDVCLCALTVNSSAPCRLGDRFPKRCHTAARRFALTPSVRVEGDDIIIENGAFYMTLDTSRGLFVKSVRSAFSDTLTTGGALLSVIEDGRVTDTFVRTELASDHVTFRHKDLYITVTITVDGEADGVRLGWSAENRGVDTRVGIRFPALNEVTFRDAGDTWYFLPKYQNTESNGSCWVYEESSPSYPMQFMDLFSPTEGCGLALLTRERGLKVRRYGLTKQRGVTNAFVEYPGMYGRIPAGGNACGSETVLFVHEDDWRAAMRAYKCWLDSWYVPYKCQDKKWYRQKFWLLAEITDFIETKDVFRFPVWYAEEDGKKSFRFKEILETTRDVYGEMPDILHLWCWTFDENQQSMFGHYGDTDYDKWGGLDAFRGALRDASDATGAEISLYMHPTLLTARYPEAAGYMDKGLRVKGAAGQYIHLGDAYRMCHANPEWREHVLENYPRVQRETGVRLLYVDEFSLRVDNRCWAEGHGHEVPSNLLKTDREFISALKDRMPEDVVLYGEYYAADVNARYIDCNISYYILDTINAMIEQGIHSEDGSDEYGRVFSDVYRFMFPRIVQLVLPMAMRHKSWQPLKAIFYNGEAVYDSLWDVEESRGREFMAKAYRIKKEYADCFSGDAPDTMLDAPSDALCVNRFDGEGRNVYTIFNRGFHTWEGETLVLPYREGARYLDLWNGGAAPFTVRDGKAYVSLRVTAQHIGCVAELFR